MSSQIKYFIKIFSKNPVLYKNVRSIYASRIEGSSNRTSVTRTNRSYYPRTYPVCLVQPDGSTITIRYKEPRKIIRLPVDLEALSPEMKQERLRMRKPKQKVVLQDDIDINFDVADYEDLWKKH